VNSRVAVTVPGAGAVRPAQPAGLLQVNDVWGGYGSGDVIRGASFAVGQSSVVGLVGPNGAGKTTLLRGISGKFDFRSGEVRFNGRDIGSIPPHARAQHGIAHVPQGRRLFPDLSVIENLEVAAGVLMDRDGARERIAELAQMFPIIDSRGRQKAGTLSGGEQQMVAIARGLVGKPRLLLLDEPSLGLAPAFIARVVDLLKDLVSEGQTILLAEQNVGMASALCTHLNVVNRGAIAATGATDEILRGGAMESVYLGSGR
jgi:branched-chain amino acid transport system ATP-binding protein